MTLWNMSHVATDQVSPQVERVVNALGNQTLSTAELMDALDFSDRKSFRGNYLKPALDSGLIEMTIPEKPNSRLQKYRRTK